jgi:TonB family protein
MHSSELRKHSESPNFVLGRSMRGRTFFLVGIGVAILPVAGWAYNPAAMTVDGRVFHTTPKKPGRWNADILKHEWPGYPLDERRRHHEGTGWFRLELRPDGSILGVKVMQSTGYSVLDQSAIAALSRWRFKAGKWKWVDEPMWFSVQGPHGNL